MYLSLNRDKISKSIIKKNRCKKYKTEHTCILQQNLSKPNLFRTNICIRNRQMFGLNRLNEQRFPTLELYVKIGLYRIQVYLGFGLYS